jgi:hypothetical protein
MYDFFWILDEQGWQPSPDTRRQLLGAFIRRRQIGSRAVNATKTALQDHKRANLDNEEPSIRNEGGDERFSVTTRGKLDVVSSGVRGVLGTVPGT